MSDNIPGECFADLAYAYLYRVYEDRHSPSPEIRADAEAELARPGLTTMRLVNALELDLENLNRRVGVARLSFRNREING